MTPIEQESILTLSLMAAFSDGTKNDAERVEVRRIAESLPQAGFVWSGKFETKSTHLKTCAL